MTRIVSPSSTSTGLMYARTKSDPAWALWVETLAPYEVLRQRFEAQTNPTSQATFSQWSRDANPGGFSAKMFLHLTRMISAPRWTCLDTEALLSEWIARHLLVRAGVVSSWQPSMSRKSLIGSSAKPMTPKMINGIARRSIKRAKQGWGHHCTVLLRDHSDWTIAKITFGKDRSGAYVCSHTLSGSLFKDSLLDGLTEYLTRLANESSETPSRSPSPDGSASELEKH